MPESNIALYMAAELAALLLLVTIFLLFHVKKLKKLIAKLEQKIITLRQSMGLVKKNAAEIQKKLTAAQSIKPKAYMDFLDQQIQDTRDHHNTLNPDRDIVLDISTDSPLDRQAAALRHAFLIAEKEADYSGEGDNSDWDVLQSKFQQIIQFYEQAAEPDEAAMAPVDIAEPDSANDEEVAALKKRIENLEKFKKLFFEMEGKWNKAKKEADGYQEQLAAMGEQMGGGEEFEGLLKRYADSYGQVGDMIVQGADGAGKTVVEIDARTMEGSRTVIGNQDEVDRLRNMAADQHKVITELKRKLVDANTAEEQSQVIGSLSEQLDRQDRFLKEAETCAQLLEDELNRALDENQELREQAEAGGGSSAELDKLEGLVGDLTDGSREMLTTIASLEDENKQLQQQIITGAASSGGGGPLSAADAEGVAEEVEVLNKKLLSAQQELLDLQTQHIELEERYLELKMESM